jgi:cell division protein FtsL
MEDNSNHHHHHQQHQHQHQHQHHHTHHVDDSEIYKRKTLSASKRRKIIGKALFAILSLFAVAIVLFAMWIYTHE